MTDIADKPVPTGELVLSLRGISKNFGAVSALTDIDLDVHAGEVVALVGDNGAGKSTLVKILAGVHQPSSGTINFRGKQVTLPDPERRARRSASPPSSRIWRCARTSTSSPTSSSARSSTRCGSTRWRWRSAPGRCSTNCRRASRACANRSPRCPAASARPWRSPARCCSSRSSSCSTSRPPRSASRRRPRCSNLIERVRDRGLGVVMISHNMEDVRAVADRIVVLRLGRNNGVFYPDASNQELVSAITGAANNAVSRRAERRKAPNSEQARRRGHERRDQEGHRQPSTAARPQRRARQARGRRRRRDPRLLSTASAPAISARCRSSSGLVIIWTVFTALNPVFLSSQQPRQPAVRLLDRRRHLARHRLHPDGRRDRPVGRLGQRLCLGAWSACCGSTRAGRWRSPSSPRSPSAA